MNAYYIKVEIHCSFITTTVGLTSQGPGHTTREPQVGFELASNSIQFYAIANFYSAAL